MTFQTELLTPEPPRTIRAPESAGWWGIDPSTERVSIAYVAHDGRRGVMTRSFNTRLRDGARLEHFYEETQDLVSVLLAETRPGYVLIEQPFSARNDVPPVSYLVMGTIMLAVAQTVRANFGVGVLVEPIAPQSWKATGMGRGHGHAAKVTILRWARANGYGGLLQDEADAWGVAEAARRLVGFSECVLSAG